MAMKGIALISWVIFLLLTIVAVVFIYQAGVPFVSRLQDATIVDQVQGTFIELNKIVEGVATGGKGSKRTITLSVDAGRILVDSASDTIQWLFETNALIVSPRTAQDIGNLRIGEHLTVSAKNMTYDPRGDNIPAFKLENEHLIVYVKQIGTPPIGNVPYSTTDIILDLYNKDLQTSLAGSIQIAIDDDTNAFGFTELLDEGDHLPSATVSIKTPTVIFLTLEAGADFLIIEGK